MLLCSLRCIVFNCLWLNYLTLCKGLGLGLGLEVQSLGLGLDQEGLVLVLGNFWSLGLGIETTVLVLVLKQKSYLHLCILIDRALLYINSNIGELWPKGSPGAPKFMSG